MHNWALHKKLDDYESVRMDYLEALEFANNEFIEEYKPKEVEINTSAGQKFPKYYIAEGVENYNVEDFRHHDAKPLPNVMRSNANFRYGNVIKKWETNLYKRNYDRDEHAAGLGDIRELYNIDRGYNMEKIHGANEYASSDFIMHE